MAEYNINPADIAKLSRKLDAVGDKLGRKEVGQAMRDATKFFVAEMKSEIPVGKKWHKTYKGLIVPPGFAKRSIRRFTRRTDEGVALDFGVAPQAFYAINFIDLGPITVKSRRVTRKSGIRANTTKTSRGRVFQSRGIKPYTIRPKHWLLRPFIRNQGKFSRNISKELKKQIDKVTRG